MSCIVIGTTAGDAPVVYSIVWQQIICDFQNPPFFFTVGVIAYPLRLMILFPRDVSILKIASMAGSTSCLFIVESSTGDPINGTGSCGTVGALVHK